MKRSAFAKLNLNLRITGKQANGYHTLHSLIAFTDACDEVAVYADIPPTPYPLKAYFPESQLTLYCRSHAELDPTFMSNNLIAKAASALRAVAEEYNIGEPCPAHITLEKNLPIGAGLGGGSSDAAAALSLLNSFWKLHLSPLQLRQIARNFGSDISACLTPRAQWMTGTGNELKDATIEASLWVVLVYPNTILTAKDVYAALDFPPDQAEPAVEQEDFSCADNASLLRYLQHTQNDLTTPAKALAPVIQEIISTLEKTKEVQLVRMSGSGSACFGLYLTKQDADAAAQSILLSQPAWWVQAARLMV